MTIEQRVMTVEAIRCAWVVTVWMEKELKGASPKAPVLVTYQEIKGALYVVSLELMN